jgi:hypothetical protein
MFIKADQSGKIVSPAEHGASLKAFIAACEKKNLLTQSESLESRDLCDGLSDPPALLYAFQNLGLHYPVADLDRRFLTARRFDPDGALMQFEEAQRFREEKHIIRLYDMIKIADYEEARQLVSKRVLYWNSRISNISSVSPLDGPQRQERPTHLLLRC